MSFNELETFLGGPCERFQCEVFSLGMGVFRYHKKNQAICNPLTIIDVQPGCMTYIPKEDSLSNEKLMSEMYHFDRNTITFAKTLNCNTKIYFMQQNRFYLSKLHCFGARALRVAAFVLLCGTASAQDMLSYDNYVSGLDNASREHFESLTGDVQTTVFINSGSMALGGQGSATVLDLSVNEFASLDWNSPLLSAVELIRIRVNEAAELNATLDLSASAALSQLHYVLILTGIEATPAQISQLVVGASQNVQMMYSISIPN